MLLSEDSNDAQYQIKAYHPGEVRINTDCYTHSLIISTDTLITDWPPTTLDEATSAHIDTIFSLQPDVILLGTGEQAQQPSQLLRQALAKSPFAIEYMSNSAACRTFIALQAEARRVVAALLINPSE